MYYACGIHLVDFKHLYLMPSKCYMSVILTFWEAEAGFTNSSPALAKKKKKIITTNDLDYVK